MKAVISGWQFDNEFWKVTYYILRIIYIFSVNTANIFGIDY